MQTRMKKIGVFVAEGLFTTGLASREASAKTITTPFGDADESCVHETPMGGNIDTRTGDVRVNGKFVKTFAQCNSGWKLKGKPQASQRPETQPPVSGGWYSWTDAQAPSIAGTTYPFDGAYMELQIPTAPSPPAGHSPLLYYFNSLQNNQALSSNGTGCGTSNNVVLIQPVLQWGTNGSNGGAFWSMAAWEVWGCNSDCVTNCSVGHSPYVTVSAGDYLEGSMWQTAHSPDVWEIRWDDSNGAFTWNTMTISNSLPKFQSYQGGVFEGHNLSTCTDLPPGNSLLFYNFGVDAAYPAWNSYDEVDVYGSNLLSFSGWHNTTLAPVCGPASASVNGSTDDTTLTWVE